MNTELKSKKQITFMTLLFTITYMISYITRINYGAIISEMESATRFSRSLLSMALTGSFVTYGAGQIVSGFCGDKFPPKRLVTYGLVATVVMNLVIPICRNPWQMTAVWCINGFAQSFMWPPIVKLMTALFSDEEYQKATVRVSWGSSMGTIAVYLMAPVIISLSGWRAVFVFSALCGIVMIILWNKFCINVPIEQKKSQERKSKGVSLFSPLMLCVMLGIILQGMLRDGVTTWMPTYISETYNMSNIISILTGVVLPIFSILCFQAASTLYRTKFTNPMMCAGVIFGVGACASLALICVTGHSASMSVMFSALLTGCMHGVNLILICMVPTFFKKNGNVSTAAGVLNSCTYIGSAISTYGIALVSENLGWGFTLKSWFAIALLGTAVCLVCVRLWNRKFE